MSSTSSTLVSLGVYNRADARDIAAGLAARFWPGPASLVSPLALFFDVQTALSKFGQTDVSALETAISDFSRTKVPVGDSGLDATQFMVHALHVAQCLLCQRVRTFPDPESARADGPAALRDAFSILLASTRSSAVRRALDKQVAAVITGRPTGLAHFSRRRSRRSLEASVPAVRTAAANLVAACESFLAGS